MDIKLRTCKDEDIDSILSIQTFWYSKHSTFKKGFLFGIPYTKDDLYSLFIKGYIAVAEQNKNIIGYFLVDNVTSNETSTFYRRELSKIKNDFNYLKDSVCPRAQIGINIDYLGLGVSNMLTNYMIFQMKDRYKYLFSMVSRNNSNIRQHKRNGWQIIKITKTYYYVILKI